MPLFSPHIDHLRELITPLDIFFVSVFRAFPLHLSVYHSVQLKVVAKIGVILHLLIDLLFIGAVVQPAHPLRASNAFSCVWDVCEIDVHNSPLHF